MKQIDGIQSSFDDLGLSPGTLAALRAKGFEEPTSIQAACIPLVLKKQVDVVGQAQTGTGKTAAFGLPIIETIDPANRKVQALIMTPTRELAVQVSEEIHSLSGNKRISITPIYGGQSIGLQISKLRSGVHVVVGTPGRIYDHLQRGTLVLDGLKTVVLDEADEMLNMGFIEDIQNILDHTPKERRMLLFSATMPKPILRLAETYMGTYEHIRIDTHQMTTDLTDQIYFEVHESDKLEALSRIIDIETEFYGLVFCRTKVGTDQVVKQLQDRGYDVEALHGDVSQNQREAILEKFRKRKISILVATDVAARGIDINDLTHVINYSLPQNHESYIHRIGRTGRAGKEGTAITFITPSEYRKLMMIGKLSNSEIRKKQVPAVKDIIDTKKERIRQQVRAIMERGDYHDYMQMITDMAEDADPYQIAASLMALSFQEQLDESNYREISEPNRQNFVDRKGKTRLFVGKGRKEQFTKKNIVDYITKKAKIRGSAIYDIQIFESYSFITVPFQEAEIILDAFRNINAVNNRPVITRAKEPTSGPVRPSGPPRTRTR